MSIVWVDRTVEMPIPPKGDKSKRVLAFSPDYPEGHDMRYRTMDCQFYRIMTDATHWTWLTPPTS